MNKKLTLSIDSAILDKAKHFAQHEKKSISGLVESFLNMVTSGRPDTPVTMPVTQSLKGILVHVSPDKTKLDYGDHLLKKYS